MAEAGAAPDGRRILITGATGFIGRHLVARLLARGVTPIALTRDPRRAARLLGSQVACIANLADLPDTTALDAVVNLAGATILGPPWTAARRTVLRESRLITTRSVVALCQRLQIPRLVSASAVGYYGVRGEETLTEAAGPQEIFQSRLCSDWEAEATRASPGTGVALLRFGVVLGRDGGALPQLARPVRFGLGSILGSGQQWAPWIHLEDALRLIEWCLQAPGRVGAVNAVAPEAVTHAQLQAALGRVLGRPIWLRVPAAVLRAGLGEMAQLLVDGQHVVPARALQEGFEFRHPWLEPALADLLQAGARGP